MKRAETNLMGSTVLRLELILGFAWPSFDSLRDGKACVSACAQPARYGTNLGRRGRHRVLSVQARFGRPLHVRFCEGLGCNSPGLLA